MTPLEFIAKWQASTRNERAACQEHFLDLCALLEEPTPNTDPTGEHYAFEKGATRFTGQEGWADVWRRSCFAWEYKKKRGNLDAAHRQLLLYAGPLGNPPLLIVSDIARTVIRTNWTNAVTETHEIALEDLADPLRLRVLKWAFSDPDQLRPKQTRQGLTEEAATAFAELARRLRDRGNDPQKVAHFINRLVFCLFANDVGLLPAGLFGQMLSLAHRRPHVSARLASELFGAMAGSGGMVGFVDVPWFNGGLFKDSTSLPLEKDDLTLLIRVSGLRWAEIDPSILGTLFERGLDPDKRSQLGAHYTDRTKIEMIIDPVIRRPLLAEWTDIRGKIEAALAAAPVGRGRRAATGQDTARALYHGFLERLRAFRVLDPACGSGNFLYLSLQALKDLEHQAGVEVESLGLQREFPQVGPETMLGIEINPYAAELARVSVWIGHIQWTRAHGYAAPSDPVLKPLDTIECRDAVLTPDGKIAEWPKADVIVGNPPFLGDKGMIGVLGEEYTETLRQAYKTQMPGAVDLVCFWFANAWRAVSSGNTFLAGLVATQSIRKGSNRQILDLIVSEGSIFEAWSDEPWTVDGAAVRVSLVCFSAAETNAALDGQPVSAIHADLTSGRNDLTALSRLSENTGISFQGPVKVGPFDVPGNVARVWLAEPLNPNGRPNSDVLRPWINGESIAGRTLDKWIIDFSDRTLDEVSSYIKPFSYVLTHVKPKRDTNRRDKRRLFWWQHGETTPGLRVALAARTRFIATPRVAKHRLFVWCDMTILPDSRVQAIAHDDYVIFGILHGRMHEVWSLALASRHGVGNDPTYNNQICFETFPFPEHLTPNLPAASHANNPHAQTIAAAARELVEKRDFWLNPPDLTERVPEVVPGYPDRIVPRDARAAAVLKTRTLTTLYNTRGTPEGRWLDNLHRALDQAVAAAYGWPADLADDEILSRLLALNHARVAVPGK